MRMDSVVRERGHKVSSKTRPERRQMGKGVMSDWTFFLSLTKKVLRSV